METGDMVYHKLLGKGVLIDTYKDNAIVRFLDGNIKKVGKNMIFSSDSPEAQEIRNRMYKHCSEQHIEEMEREDERDEEGNLPY